MLERSGKIEEIILYKVGRTVKKPSERVGNQENANGEKYFILESFKSKFHKFVEYALHWLFQDQRVVKTDSVDGKTEWFLIDKPSLMVGVNKVR